MTDEEIRLKIAELKGTNIRERWPTDLVAAWELVEEMRAEENDVDMKMCFGTQVMVIVTPCASDKFKMIDVKADTALRAICLAYIAWKEAQ